MQEPGGTDFMDELFTRILDTYINTFAPLNDESLNRLMEFWMMSHQPPAQKAITWVQGWSCLPNAKDASIYSESSVSENFTDFVS